MDSTEAFGLFEEMIGVAQRELVDCTLNSDLDIATKADQTLVTKPDKIINTKLIEMAGRLLSVVSEEGAHDMDIVRGGTYATIDPIDGTKAYIDYVNAALQTGDIKNFAREDLGPKFDFGLLLGIVIDGVPSYGASYNYVTNETILIDGADPNNLVWKNQRRKHVGQNVVYVDGRDGGKMAHKLKELGGVELIPQSTLGLRSIYASIGPHENAATAHRTGPLATPGIWDVMPGAVAARAFGATILDGNGNPLQLTQYIKIPGHGLGVIQGEKFQSVKDLLKENPYHAEP